MKPDDELQRLWLSQALPAIAADALLARLRRHRLRQVLMRGVEVVLTFGAIAWFGARATGPGFAPVDWLLFPFYAVFLVVAWWRILRRGPATRGAEQAASRYVAQRLEQLRIALRELRFGDMAGAALLAYATLTGAIAWLAGMAAWRNATLWLLAAALAWYLLMRALTTRLRRRHLAEMRALRRLQRD
jgi:membrane protein implicated in regulation of membrane protease activity